jgi:hypothetical protein
MFKIMIIMEFYSTTAEERYRVNWFYVSRRIILQHTVPKNYILFNFYIGTRKVS